MKRPSGPVPRRAAILPLAALGLLLLWSALWGGPAPSPPLDLPPSAPIDTPAATHPTLQILWDQELLSDPSPAMDVRWASDRTVYVAWLHHGVSELTLDGNFKVLRDLFPDARGYLRSRYQGFDQLAVSNQHVVASSTFNTLGFRDRQAPDDGHLIITRVPVGIVEDLDLSGHRILMLGNPGTRLTPTGGIAWLGPLSGYPAIDLKPILFDVAGANSPTLIHCAGLDLGGARFLPDGSFVVVPGFQPGAHHFDAAGHLLHTWDTFALGLDGDAGCASVTDEQFHSFRLSETARYAYINQHRVLDDILPLAQGPGLLVRSVAGGKVHWQIKVLQDTATIVYDVPLTGSLPYDRLRGDVQGNRIVLLLTANSDRPYRRGHIYVAQLPRVLVAPVVTEGGQQ
jgi:hypothetical protein